MKQVFIFTSLLTFLVGARLPAHTSIVGYGSTATTLSSTDQAIFHTGFDLGIRGTLKAKLPENWLLTMNSAERGELAPAAVGQRLVTSGVTMLAGFPTSHEALMMAEIAKKNNLLAFSAAAGHQDLASVGPMVYSCAESMDLVSAFFLESLNKYFKSKKGLLVVSPKSVFSINQEVSLRKVMQTAKLNREIEIETLRIDDPKERLSKENMDRLRKQDYEFVFIGIYPEESSPLFYFLDNLPKHVPIYTSTWTVVETEMLRQLLSRYRAPVYSTAIWLPGNKESRDFEKHVRRALGREPSAELAYSYDMGVVTATVLNRAKGDFSKENLLKAFHANPCFDNTSAGKLCFDPKGGHALRKLYLVQFVKEKGFILPVK